MTSFQKFQREVNFFKNIVLFLIFIALTLYVFFNLVSPTIERYKEINKEEREYKDKLVFTTKDHGKLSSTYDAFYEEHKNTLMSTDRIYSKVELSKLLEQYFTDFELEEKSNDKIKNYYISNIGVKSKTTNPKNFYLFVKNLSKLNSLVEIAYPIEFESKNGYLDISFTLRAYIFY